MEVRLFLVVMPVSFVFFSNYLLKMKTKFPLFLLSKQNMSFAHKMTLNIVTADIHLLHICDKPFFYGHV